MEKIRVLLLWSLFILILFTFFYMQNRIFVPVRLTFSSPTLFPLPLLVLFSFICGSFFSYIFLLFNRAGSAKNVDPIYQTAKTDSNKRNMEWIKKNIPEPSTILEFSNSSECANCKKDLEKLFLFTADNILTDKLKTNKKGESCTSFPAAKDKKMQELADKLIQEI